MAPIIILVSRQGGLSRQGGSFSKGGYFKVPLYYLPATRLPAPRPPDNCNAGRHGNGGQVARYS